MKAVKVALVSKKTLPNVREFTIEPMEHDPTPEVVGMKVIGDRLQVFTKRATYVFEYRETPSERFRRKQRERAAAAKARSKRDRERAPAVTRTEVSEEAAEAARRRVHERTFPEESQSYEAYIEKRRLDSIVTDKAVRMSQENAKRTIMAPDGVALSKREPMPTIDELIEQAKKKMRQEGRL